MYDTLIRTSIASACFFITFLTGKIRLCLTKENRVQRLIRKAEESGSFAEAWYSGREQKFSRWAGFVRSTPCLLFYAYTADGKEYEKEIRTWQPNADCIEVPGKVMVYFDPSRPQKAFCKEELRTGRLKWNFAFFALSIAVYFATLHISGLLL